MSVSITSETHLPTSVLIHGSRGTIAVEGPCFRPEAYTLTTFPSSSPTPTEPSFRRVETKITGRGMYWMGDEVGRCLREGRTESERMGWAVTELQMGVFDEVSPEGTKAEGEKGEGVRGKRELIV